MKPLKIVLFVFACLSCWLVTSQFSLRYKLSEGSTFQIKQESNQTIVQKMDGMDNIVNNTIESVLKFKVTKELKDAYELQVVFIDIKIRIHSNLTGEILNIDVAKTADNAQNRIFKSLLNYPITAVLKTNGDITDIKGCERLIEQMLSQANVKDKFTRDLMRSSLENDFGTKAMAQNYKQMTYFYPDRKVALNESWHTLCEGDLETDNTWKLIAVNGKKVVLAAQGTTQMDINKSGMHMQLSGKQKSRLIASAYTGFLQELTIEGVAKGNSEIELEEGVKEIPTVITSKIKYNIIN